MTAKLGGQMTVPSKLAGAPRVMGRRRGRSELERQVLKRATDLLEYEEAACPPPDGLAVASLTAGEGQAGFARSRAILYLGRAVSIQGEAAGQYERYLLLVRLRRPSGEISATKLAKKPAAVTC